MTLDDAMLGCAATRWRPFPGLADVRVGVRALSVDERTILRREAEDDVRLRNSYAKLPEKSRGALVAREFQRRVLAKAVVVDDGEGGFSHLTNDDLASLDDSTINALLLLFANAHDNAYGDGDSKSVLDAIDAFARSPLERLRAREAANLCAYYGVSSARVLTPWQLIVFARLIRKDAP